MTAASPDFARMHYAGFWRRFAAYWFDMVSISLPTFFVFYYFLGFSEVLRDFMHGPNDFASRQIFMDARHRIRDVSFTLWLIYCVSMDASRYQGTMGKRLMGMRVVDETGCRLSFVRAVSRNVGKIVSTLPLFLGFMWIGWSKTKQGWHDRMSHTFIVLSQDNELEPRFPRDSTDV